MSLAQCVRFVKLLFSLFLLFTVFPHAVYSAEYTVTITPVTATALEGSSLQYTVTLVPALSNSDTLKVTVSVAGSAGITGSDYGYTAPDLTFSSTQTSFNVEILTLADAEIEHDETLTVKLDNAVFAGVGTGNVDISSSQTGTIKDNTLQVSIDSQMSPESIAENQAGVQTVNVKLNRTTDYDVKVGFKLGGTAKINDDFTVNYENEVTIPAGKDEATISVTPVNDSLVEADEIYTITLDSLNPQGSAVIVAGSNIATGGITNDDTFVVSVAAPSPSPVAESVDLAENPKIVFTLTNPVDWEVEVLFSFSGCAIESSDYIPYLADTDIKLQGSIIIPRGDTTAVITIDPVNDKEVESDEDYILTLHALAPTTSGSLAPSSEVTGTISDNDYTLAVSAKTVSQTPLVAGGRIFSWYDYNYVSVPPDPNETKIVVERDDTPLFQIVAKTCHHITDILVDSVPVEITWQDPDVYTHTYSYYQFEPVNAVHTIHADFAINTYSITTNALNPDNGTITTTASSVDCDSSGHIITATAKDGYTITWFKVNGVEQTAAYKTTEFEFIADNVTENLDIEVAFSNKIILTHSSPFGTVASNPTDFYGRIDVDYGTEFVPLFIKGNDHAVQGPGAIAKTANKEDNGSCTDPDTGNVVTTPTVDAYCNYIDSKGMPIYLTDDVRSHTHHLSSVIDNGTNASALCLPAGAKTTPAVDVLNPADPFYGAYTETDYSASTECYYGLEHIVKDHEVEILFTSFLDLRSFGYGDIKKGATVLVNGTTDGKLHVGELEVPGKSTVTVTFAPLADWYVANVQLKKEEVDSDRRVQGIKDLPALVSLGGRASYTFTELVDQDWGVHALYKVNEITLQAMSTFEKVLFADAALTKLITKKNNNQKAVITVGQSGSFYVVINDPDYAVVGVSIDSNFIEMKKIREYATTPANNPDKDIFTFSISTTADLEELLTVKFSNVQVSHSLEVRDYDGVIISDLPLDAQIAPNPPAVMFVLDDSGSMDFEIMVKETTGGTYFIGQDDFRDDNGSEYYKEYYYIYDFPFSRLYTQNWSTATRELGGVTGRNEWRSRFAHYNKMFYKPSVSYSPWPTFAGQLELPSGNISSKLPAVDKFTDGRAHADMYRPRYYPWHNVDCVAALAISEKKRNGSTLTAADKVALGACDNQQTFDLDGTYMAIGATADNVKLFDQGSTSRSGLWWGGYDVRCNQKDAYYSYGNSSYAAWTFTPTVDGVHNVEVSWMPWTVQSNNVQYHIQCTNCSPQVDVTVNQDQTQLANYSDGMKSLGEYTFQKDKAVKVTVSSTVSNRYWSIDALRFTWEATSIGLANIINAHYFTWDDSNGNNVYDSTENIWLVNLTDPITYTRVKDKTEPLSQTNLDTTYTGSTLPSTVHLVTYAGPTDKNAFVLERQNFADWFSYYRSRAFSATAGISLAIEKMSNVEVGIQSINYNAESGRYGISQSVLPVNVWGERDKTKYLYYLLYNFKSQEMGTPLVRGLSDVASYFDATDGKSGGVVDTVKQSGITTTGIDDLSPFAIIDNVEKEGDRCKDVFSILVTDGYWNGTIAEGEVFSGADSHLKPMFSNTLASIAYDYYAYEADIPGETKDLMKDANGDRQRMLTYGVAFGVTGALPYSSTCSFDDPTGCPANWNKPVAGLNSTVDDLWHASVNGGGQFISAESPDTLVTALSSIIENIRDLEGSSASLAAGGDELHVAVNDELRMFQPSWNSSSWYGDLEAYAVDAITGDVATSRLWSAAATLSARVSGNEVSNARIIATYNPTAKEGVEFSCSRLSTDQQEQLFPYYSPTRSAEDVVHYLRGDYVTSGSFCLDGTCFPDFRDRSYDDTVGKVKRTRVLGDIINSQGVFQDYPEGGIIFIGANDGMLHAFSATDEEKGKELFAYVPNLVFRNLRVLADPDFSSSSHKMFVDASPAIQTIKYKDASGNSVTKTLLVGGLGKGGKGYFALDVTDARKITSESLLAKRVLWEFPGPQEKILSAVVADFAADSITLAIPLTEDQKEAIKTSKFITVQGANYNSGSLQASNDGTYEVFSISSDNKIITITKPVLKAMSNIKMSLFESISDHDMGYSFAKPNIVKSNDPKVGAGGWVVVFGNGYGSDGGMANLFILDPLTGKQITDNYNREIGKIKTLSGPFNGLSRTTVIDVNNDLKADYAYAGDMLGNMWKFDLYSSPANYTEPTVTTKDWTAKNWQVAFCTGGDSQGDNDDKHCDRTITGMVPKPLFSTLLKQPIIGAPDIMRHKTKHGYMVIFGTGKYLGWIDLESTDLQSLYGIWDWAPDYYDIGFLGTRADNLVGDVKYLELTNWTRKNVIGAPEHSLLEQTVLFEGNISEDLNNDGKLTDTEDVDGDNVTDIYFYYRIPSYHEGDWRLAYNNKLSSYGQSNIAYGSKTFLVPLGNMGWAFDLTGKIENVVYAEGERMINDTIIRDGKAIMISFGLSGDKCGSSAYSFLNERDANTGGMLFNPVYDVNNDSVVNRKDSIYFENLSDDDKSLWMNVTDQTVTGRASNPIIGVRDSGPDGKTIEDKYISSSAISNAGGGGTVIKHIVESAERVGLFYWKQVE